MSEYNPRQLSHRRIASYENPANIHQGKRNVTLNDGDSALISQYLMLLLFTLSAAAVPPRDDELNEAARRVLIST
ncbi:hypothetical protein N7481_007088 [Penicillium waksmanii]|uniref:uncharacterized protein n=1 Tax=Penicillium waksmanii TaxID=69791 RepID=UPI002546F6CB|nr:uncharacterized protein N7481_007088 [Penicillium waksmanii]KAJ5979790.1 hypothetical protein N7481_007088 [Penicillium waksmanii]